LIAATLNALSTAAEVAGITWCCKWSWNSL